MDLDTILKKTQSKSEKIKRNREPVHVAMEERPYDLFSDKNLTNETTNKLETNQQQTTNKVLTNYQQSNNDTENKVTTNYQQSNNKLPTQLTTTNYQQSNNKLLTTIPFSALVGLQRNLTFFFYQECKKTRSKITEPLTIEYINQYVKSEIKTVKTTIYRLEVKGCVKRIEFKNGRGGWTRYELPDQIFREILTYENNNKLLTNYQQSDNNAENKVTTNYQQSNNKLPTQLTTKLLSSSSNIDNINKITTTTLLPEEWQKLNLKKLHEAFQQAGLKQNQFFGVQQLKGIYKTIGNRLSVEEIQSSIDNFSYGLIFCRKQEPYSTMRNPGAVIFERLKNGDIWIEPKFLTPHEQQIKLIYDNLSNKFDNDIKIHFNQWIDQYKNKKYGEYKQKMPSNHFLTESEFLDMAWKDYNNNVWKNYKKNLIIELMGEDNRRAVEKFELISQCE